MKFAVAIADADGIWTDVSEQVVSVTRGSSNPDAVITECSVDFGFDFDGLGSLLDPRIGKGKKRIRITIADITSYYLLEKGPGKVQHGYKNTTVTGRAYAGLLDDFSALSYAWDSDVTASNLCNQVARADVKNQGGEYIPVVWSATLNPLIPGGRYSVSKQRRRDIIAEVAAACNAMVRTTSDGLCLEVIDIPSLPLAGTAKCVIRDMLDLSYSDELCTNPHNAVRVIGEVIEYTRATLPTVTVTLAPDSLLAGDTETAEARATVRDSAGNLVKHTGVVDEAITAGSYTEIPVSGCYSVQGVWLNSGSADDPVKGAAITPTSFNASTINVPDNGTQLFVVSYTQATEVSWSVSDLADEIDGESSQLIGDLDVRTLYAISRVRGVYLATDTNRTGTDYYTGGSFEANTKYITLGISPGPIGTALLVDYDRYTGSSVNAVASPATSLCDENGYAYTLVDPGTVAGTALVEASALSVTGEAGLSITGYAIASLTLAANPSVIRSHNDPTEVYDTATETVELYGEVWGGIIQRLWVEVENPVTGVTSVTQGGTTLPVAGWYETGGQWYIEIYYNQAAPIFPTIGDSCTVVYQTSAEVEDAYGQSTVTATLEDINGDPVSDGTEVSFWLEGRTNNAEISADAAFTSDGIASVTITGGRDATFDVYASAGGYTASLEIVVTEDPQQYLIDLANADDGWGTIIDSDCTTIYRDSNDSDGNIEGRRRIIGCDGEPLGWETVLINKKRFSSDSRGWVEFDNGITGSNDIVLLSSGARNTFTIDPLGSESRGSGSYEVC